MTGIKRVALLCCILCMAFFAACAAPADEESADYHDVIDVQGEAGSTLLTGVAEPDTPTEVPQAVEENGLFIEIAAVNSMLDAAYVTDVFRSDGELSEDIQAQLIKAASGAGLSVQAENCSVSVTYQSDELISCLMEVEQAELPGALVLLPITLSKETGNSIMLQEFFAAGDTGWHGKLADIVMTIADDEDITLLGDVQPVSNTHPYFILDGNIVLLYRQYEIATFEAGIPCFVLPMDELQGYVSGAYGVGRQVEEAVETKEVGEIME